MFGNDFQVNALSERLAALEKKLHDMESKPSSKPVIMFPMKNVMEGRVVGSGMYYFCQEVPRKKDICEVVQMILDHLKLEFAVEPAKKEEISLQKIGKPKP